MIALTRPRASKRAWPWNSTRPCGTTWASISAPKWRSGCSRGSSYRKRCPPPLSPGVSSTTFASSFPTRSCVFLRPTRATRSTEATPSEESLIRYFEQHPEADAWSGTMEFFEQGEKYFVCAVPRRFETSCLQCHGRPEDAPASLLERYGPVAGFGRSVGEVSVDLAAIPVSASYVDARAQISRHMLIALGLCLLFLAGIAFLIRADARRRRRRRDRGREGKESPASGDRHDAGFRLSSSRKRAGL